MSETRHKAERAFEILTEGMRDGMLFHSRYVAMEFVKSAHALIESVIADLERQEKEQAVPCVEPDQIVVLGDTWAAIEKPAGSLPL